MAIFQRTAQVSWYQNVSILDFIGAEGDGNDGDNWSYKMCAAVYCSSKMRIIELSCTAAL